MSIELSADEMREVVLAIDAYRQSLERIKGSRSAGSSIRALESARAKINSQCRGDAEAPVRWRTASE
ncbi:MAG TPA: hypothetical protein VN442_00040 [Bryobacteraceae bacterium]|nr:hypothetical protein [Bryobacteraceae bacterium]